jgi:hypothetical protein
MWIENGMDSRDDRGITEVRRVEGAARLTAINVQGFVPAGNQTDYTDLFSGVQGESRPA